MLSASAAKGHKRPLGIVLGVITSFTFFTLALKSLVELFGVDASLLRTLAIFIIALFGLFMIFPSLEIFLVRATTSVEEAGSKLQSQAEKVKSGFWSSFIVGLALGLVWTPCAGPILAAIVSLVAINQVTLTVFLMILFYVLGAAIPLFLIAYGGQRIIMTSKSLSRHSETIRKCFGIVMLLTAFFIFMNWDIAFSQQALKVIPNIDIEDNSLVRGKLSQMNPSRFQTNEILTNQGPAPALTQISSWINSPPLTLGELHGKVVLIDFWTYSCINCIRTLPYLTRWYETYKDKGFVIIGIHTPEFEFEKDKKNVEEAVKRFNIYYPVGLDNQYGTWRAYSNLYWPAHYLIDQQGNIRLVHFGEGKYLETENAIRTLLHESPLQEIVKKEKTRKVTPETYLGYERAKRYPDDLKIKRDIPAEYQSHIPLAEDHISLQGLWLVGKENIQSMQDGNQLELNFIADKVFLVLGGHSDEPITALLDDKPLAKENYSKDFNQEGQLFVKEPRMYTLLDLQGNYGRHKLTIKFPKGIQAYAFTFGS